jgi:hypothetical protein
MRCGFDLDLRSGHKQLCSKVPESAGNSALREDFYHFSRVLVLFIDKFLVKPGQQAGGVRPQEFAPLPVFIPKTFANSGHTG